VLGAHASHTPHEGPYGGAQRWLLLALCNASEPHEITSSGEDSSVYTFFS
jgi:hypothetical protein